MYSVNYFLIYILFQLFNILSFASTRAIRESSCIFIVNTGEDLPLSVSSDGQLPLIILTYFSLILLLLLLIPSVCCISIRAEAIRAPYITHTVHKYTGQKLLEHPT